VAAAWAAEGVPDILDDQEQVFRAAQKQQLLEEVGNVCREIAASAEVGGSSSSAMEQGTRGVAGSSSHCMAATAASGTPSLDVGTERDMLINEVGNLKAKFDLTLQTLRSILVLKADMGWADILEHIEELAASARVGSLMEDGSPMDPSELRHEELRQAEEDIESLEEKVGSQAAFITRLRELLQKQQGLLDMTTDQFERQHERNELQANRIADLEARDVRHQETMACQECRIADLSMQCERLQAELDGHEQLAEKHAAELRGHTSYIAELEAQRATQEVKFEEILSRQRTEAEVSAKNHQEELLSLEKKLSQQMELVERLTDQLQVHEAAERRRYSYRPEARPNRSAMLEDDVSVAGSETQSVCSARPSARGPRALAGSPPTISTHAEPMAIAGAVINIVEQDSLASTASTPLPSSRGHRGTAFVQAGSAAPSPSRSSSGALASMREDERVKFLAQFPMASRTERHLRNILDDRRKRQVKP